MTPNGAPFGDYLVICMSPAEWAFSGATLPGYPDVNPRREDFWDVFWKIYNQRFEPSAP